MNSSSVSIPLNTVSSQGAILLTHKALNLWLVLRHEDVLEERLQLTVEIKFLAAVVAFRRLRKHFKDHTGIRNRVAILFVELAIRRKLQKRRDRWKDHLWEFAAAGHCYRADRVCRVAVRVGSSPD